jgi:hypothetical protein
MGKSKPKGYPGRTKGYAHRFSRRYDADGKPIGLKKGNRTHSGQVWSKVPDSAPNYDEIFWDGVYGIDVSRWQGVINWEDLFTETKKMGVPVQFVILKFGDGIITNSKGEKAADEWFKKNWALLGEEMKKAGKDPRYPDKIFRGVYHYCHSNLKTTSAGQIQRAKDEAASFLKRWNTLIPKEDREDSRTLIPWIDWESPRSNKSERKIEQYMSVYEVAEIKKVSTDDYELIQEYEGKSSLGLSQEQNALGEWIYEAKQSGLFHVVSHGTAYSTGWESTFESSEKLLVKFRSIPKIYYIGEESTPQAPPEGLVRVLMKENSLIVLLLPAVYISLSQKL